MHNFEQHGIVVDKSAVGIDVGKMLEAKAKTVTGLTGGIEHLFKKNGVTYLKGHGSISGPNEVKTCVGAREALVFTRVNARLSASLRNSNSSGWPIVH